MQSEAIDTAEYLILENIYSSTPRKVPLKQRELARSARTSLGMTNSILKRLAQKGWITVKKLNSRNIRYAVTLEGLDEIVHRSYRYFKRTIDNVAYYRDSIDECIARAADSGIHTVLLIGTSDLEFIVEHCCHRYGLSILKSVDRELFSSVSGSRMLSVYAENIPAGAEKSDQSCLYLSGLLLKSPVTA